MIRYSVKLIVLLMVLVTGISAASSPTELTAPLVPPQVRYVIDGAVSIDDSVGNVRGAAVITFTNSTPDSLSELAFAWTNDNADTLVLVTEDLSMEILSGPDQEDPSLPVIAALPRPVPPGQSVMIKAEFNRTFAVESGEGKHLVTGWFPRIDWGMYSAADFSVRLDAPGGFELACSGRLDQSTGRYEAKDVRRFGLFLMKKAQVLEEYVGNFLVRVLHTEAGAECARLIMATATDVVAYYQDRFGFIPSDHIEIVPGVDYPAGGYPAATALVVIHGMERLADRDTLHWQWITAHEIGHQYWFEHVMPHYRGPFGWLMIGLGIYVDREYVRARGLGGDRHLALMDRYIRGVRRGLDTRADIHPDYIRDIGFDFNNVVVHGKGYSIISALNCYLGDSLFDRIHGRCLEQFAHRRMSFPEFQAICEEEAEEDLDWFFDQWVRSSPILAYEITDSTCVADGNVYHSSIRVERTGSLDMPVPVTVRFSDSSSQVGWTDRLRRISTLEFISDAPLTEAVIDARDELAMVVPPPTEEELRLRRQLDLIPSKAMVDSLPVLAEGALRLDIDQSLFWGQLGRKLYEWGLYEAALKVFDRRIAILSEMESDWLASAHGWRGLLLDLLHRRAEAVAAYKQALDIETESDFSYQGDPVTINRAWLEERLEVPFSNSTVDPPEDHR